MPQLKNQKNGNANKKKHPFLNLHVHNNSNQVAVVINADIRQTLEVVLQSAQVTSTREVLKIILGIKDAITQLEPDRLNKEVTF